ncbi:MAG: T9SS type A sorting domain-containing protein [Bacteroidales bacterium]|nr:T9SS type A sorting domain-containing protein [Bacteroidales bacterium]
MILLTTLLAFMFLTKGQNTLNENFDASTSLPADWTFLLDGEREEDNEMEVDVWVDSSDENDYYSGRALSGDNSAWILFQYCMDENAKIYMISPKLKVNSSQDAFTFNMYVDNYSTNEGKFYVYVSTSGKEKEDFSSEPLMELETADMFQGWEEYSVDLSDYEGQEIYVALVFADYGAYTYFFIDDVTGPELVNDDDDCEKITSLPFSENFNTWNMHEIADCWKWIGYNFFQDMYYPTVLVNGYANSNWLAFMGFDGGEEMVVCLPELSDDININDLKLNLDITNYGSGRLVVGVMNDATNINTFTPVDTLTPTPQLWDGFEVSFSDYEGSGKYIALRAGGPYDMEDVFVGVENLVLDYAFNYSIVYDTIEEFICEGESYFFKDEDLYVAGTYFDTVNADIENMEIQVLMLSVYPAYHNTIDATINEGEVYNENGFNATTEGIHTLELQTVNGCDSTITLNLTVIEVTLPCENVENTIEESICEGNSFEFNQQIYTEAGTYYAYLQTWDGCDSVVVLNLTVNPIYNNTINATINPGEVYNENGFNETTEGTYTLELQTINGCDSTVTLNLTVNSSINDVENGINVMLYPNPTTEDAMLRVEGINSDATIYVTDVQGRTIKETKLAQGEQEVRLETSTLASGVYYIRIVTDTINRTEKLIKK